MLPAGDDHARRPVRRAPTPIEDLTIDDIIRSMVGRDLDALFPKTDTAPGEVVLEVERPDAGRACSRDVSFTVRARRDRRAGRAGRRRPQRGRPGDLRHRPPRRRLASGSTAGRCRAARRARRWRPGMALVPEDRRQQGLVMDLGIDHNVALASLPRLPAVGSASGARPSAALAGDWAARLQLKYGRLDEPGRRRCPAATSRRSCSAKWLAREPQAADHRRAHPRHRRRHQGRGAPPARRARRRGHGRPDDLLRAARGARHGRPGARPARGPAGRRARRGADADEDSDHARRHRPAGASARMTHRPRPTSRAPRRARLAAAASRLLRARELGIVARHRRRLRG